MTQTENLTGQTADASLSPFVHTPPESPNHERKRAPENDPMVMNDVPNSDGPFSPPFIELLRTTYISSSTTRPKHHEEAQAMLRVLYTGPVQLEMRQEAKASNQDGTQSPSQINQ
ncbi:hypothetical protein H109_06485 [Trichophyton interdigitale MR816]|uniref:Uncharacterized protein n=1 Tax=Trichophyton interdigitale (strain MR816) TaxID=1215338 RepID=A0A059J257_TRIIM|nr:hypothetical protein H109_06485 [Trichophyton interdigitale MR816]